MESDDEDDLNIGGDLLSNMKRRTRRQYDERKDIDDLDGVDDVSFYLLLITVSVLTLRHRRKYPWSN